MERWQGKLAVITGAGSGIGAATASSLLKNGMIVVGIDKNENNLKVVANKIENNREKFHTVIADLRVEKDIENAFSWIEKNLGGIHVIVNNAGLIGKCVTVLDNDIDQWRSVLDVNVLAVTICARAALKSMLKHNIHDGNVINIASTVAFTSRPRPGFVVYTASKKAVRAVTDGMRIEAAENNTNVKFTSICPGIVDTELYRTGGVSISASLPKLTPENIAESIVFCLQLPPSVQITDLHILSTGEDSLRYIKNK